MSLAMSNLLIRHSLILADADLGAWILTANIVTTAKYNTSDANLHVYLGYVYMYMQDEIGIPSRYVRLWGQN